MDKNRRVKINLVDRDVELFNQTRRVFTGEMAEASLDRTLEHAFEKFEKETFDILIVTGAAFTFEGDSAIEMLEIIANRCPFTQILVLVYPKELPLAFSALKAGSYQYAKLPIGDEELRLLVDTALSRQPQYGQNLMLKKQPHRPGFEDMVGLSPPMQTIYRQIRQAAQTDIPVLITGETGTGKELVARAIHQLSERSEKPFACSHLGALPQELVAGELFGYEKGAFTGAWKQYKGSFEKARGGSVFLDEVGTIDERNQISLLRLLETKRFQRISGTREIRANVRIIAATNENLLEEVHRGRFREDLFYRLDVFPLELPPVRNRQGDIPLLVDHYIKHFNQAYQSDVRGVSPECINYLETYDWPGNVREIKNVIHRAMVMCSGEILLPEHLPGRLQSKRRGEPTVSVRIGTSLQDVEKEMIAKTLTWTGQNRQRTAAILGISRRTLYNKIQKYDL
jgi:DNA-binding NtrC family response regulator